MKIAIKGFMASVIWIGFLLGGHVIAQEDSLFPEEIPAGQAEPEATVDESTPAFMFSQAEPEAASEETVSLHGGTYGGSPLGPCCEVCGEGNSCPPDWYVEQGVHIMARSVPRFVPLTGQLEEVPPSTLVMPERSTRDLGFDVSAGYATTLGRDPDGTRRTATTSSSSPTGA